MIRIWSWSRIIIFADLLLHDVWQDIAAYIKKEFDKKYNPTWHCIVGRNFGSYVTHETKHFIYFYLGQVAILLFKSGWLLPGASSEICLFGILPGASRNDLSSWQYEKQSHLHDENDRVQIGFIIHEVFLNNLSDESIISSSIGNLFDRFLPYWSWGSQFCLAAISLLYAVSWDSRVLDCLVIIRRDMRAE